MEGNIEGFRKKNFVGMPENIPVGIPGGIPFEILEEINKEILGGIPNGAAEDIPGKIPKGTIIEEIPRESLKQSHEKCQKDPKILRRNQ